jgi:Homeodomain-like domain
MQRLDVLLLNGLFQDESNVRLARCRANRLSVVAVVLLTPHEGLHILRAYDLHLMPKRFELARPVECSRAGFNDNGAAFDLRRHRDKLIAHHSALQDNAAIAVDAVELEHVLRDVDAEGLDSHSSSAYSCRLSVRGAEGRAVHPISWYDLYHTGGPEALGDRSPRPDRVWNRIPDVVREQIIKLALDEPTLSPRELAVRFTDTENYLVSEASVYRLPKAHDLIASPAFIVMKAADACQTILIERERIKRQTIVNRRLMHRRQAA